MDEDDGIARIKARVAECFPGWRLVLSSKGRWWATFHPEPGQEGRHALEADSFHELWAMLGEQGAASLDVTVLIKFPVGFTLSGPDGP